jgi:hypothetical protein
MALAHRAAARLDASQLVAEGSDFAREAWRECWLPMLVVTLGHALMFVDQHVPAADWRPGLLGVIAPLLMVFYVPLYGGLYRAALGGPPRLSKGFGGLQWSAVEWRLIAVGLVLAFIAGLSMTPFLAATAVAALILHNGVFSVGPFGQWARWAPVAVVIWAGFLWLMGPRIARLALGWPFSVARERTEPFAGFPLSKGSGWAILVALAAGAVPLVLGWAAFYAIGLIEVDAISGVYWPLPEATGIGILLGALKAMVVAPMIVGVLSAAYWLLEGDHLAAGEPEAGPHHARSPEMAEAAAAAAAALAAKEAADLALTPHEAAGEAAASDAAIAAAGEHAGVDGEGAHDAASDPLAAEHGVPAQVDETHAVEGDEAAFAEVEPSESTAPYGGVEPLSPWPHSILPPWPASVRGFEAPPSRPASTFASDHAAKPLDSLASDAEPPHPSNDKTETV